MPHTLLPETVDLLGDLVAFPTVSADPNLDLIHFVGERLDRLVVWPHVDDYSPREKAALAFTEAMTRLDDQSVLPGLRATLREHFSEQEIAALGADIAMINLWNRLGVGFRLQHPVLTAAHAA